MLQELDENGNVEAIEKIKEMKKQIECWPAQTMENVGFTGEQLRMIRTAITAITKDIKDKLVDCCKYHYDDEDNCYITINDAKFYEIFRDYGVDD